MSSEPDQLLPAEEAEWIAAAQQGDRSAFARLVERYWDRIYRWLYHLTRDGNALPDDVSEATFGAHDSAADREALRLVAKAVAELPTEYRAALMLRAEQGMSFKEIAGVLNTTEETARWRVFKARQKLVKVLPPDLIPADGRPVEEKPAK